MPRGVRTCLLAAGVGVFLVSSVCPAAPALPVAGFRFGEDGELRNVAVPGHVIEDLALRGRWQPQIVRPGTVTWDSVWESETPDRLVLVRNRLGARVELLGFLLHKGSACLAARRPASTTFEGRLDWGQPGPGQGETNAWRELAADLHWAKPVETPARSIGPVHVDGRMLGPGQGPLYAATIESMAVTAMVLDGTAVRRGDGADAVRIEAGIQATVFRLRVGATWQREMEACRQGDLFPCIRTALRGALVWGDAVGAVRVIDPGWNPVSVVAAGKQLLVRKGDTLAAFAASDGRPVDAPKTAPGPASLPASPIATEALAQHEWAADPLQPPVAFGEHALVLTVSRIARVVDRKGRVVSEKTFPDRLHAVHVGDDGEAVLVDVAGRVWRWCPGAEPAMHVELGFRPHGPLVHAAAVFARWPVGTGEGELSLDSGAAGRFLLLGSRDGLLFHIPYPLVAP